MIDHLDDTSTGSDTQQQGVDAAMDAETDLESARRQLFELNGITDAMMDHWKANFGDVVWTSFLVPGVAHAVIFVYRTITRGEWKRQVRPLIQKPDITQDVANEIVASYVTLYPVPARETTYWESMPAFIPDSISEFVMNVSGGQPATQPMRL